MEIFSAHLRLLAAAQADSDNNFSMLLVIVGTIDDASVAVQCVKQEMPALFSHSISASRAAPAGSRFEFHVTSNSFYEHAGISMLWLEALRASDPSTILIYAHCKGVSHIERSGMRNTEEIAASMAILGGLYSNLEIMNILPFVNRLGCAAGGGGWFWFNFWMATASYVARLETPFETTRRHYYEDWLARDVGVNTVHHLCGTREQASKDRPITEYNLDVSKCYSLFTCSGRVNLAEAYAPEQAIEMAAHYFSRHC